jgi:hypothetical protein
MGLPRGARAAGIDVFELARVVGTSIEVLERPYGTLLAGGAAGISSRLNAYAAGHRMTATRASMATSPRYRNGNRRSAIGFAT